MTPPDISVVVPTVDRVALLERCLRGLSGQRDVTYEVIVVHDGHPGIVELLEQWRDRLPLRGLPTGAKGASAKRNEGWRAAGADIVAFTDDDCEPSARWLSQLIHGFADPGVELVQGTVLPHPEDGDVGGIFARTIEVRQPTATYPNANLAYRWEALSRVGGYDERLTAGEDTDLAWRVLDSGGSAAFVRDALVWHAVRPVNLRGHLQSLPRWASLAEVVRRHPHLRTEAYRRIFWKRSHARAWLALIGLAAAPFDRRALALVLPQLIDRRHPALVVTDWVECAVLAGGSLRARSLLL
jgi:GT2 family glycosyltransferase